MTSTFQLPLSGSLGTLHSACDYQLYYIAFNSLSRDHALGTLIELSRHSGSLSTPSLGITYVKYHDWNDLTYWLGLSTPSLGITAESRAPKDKTAALIAFNSLSRDHHQLVVEPAKEERTFNSLSRDHIKSVLSRQKRRHLFAFNSLSRDHFSFSSSEPPRLSVSAVFQLPLSGSQNVLGAALGPDVRLDFLSTPSLGITRSRCSIFRSRLMAFNSLSRDHVREMAACRSSKLSFNSLSRDHWATRSSDRRTFSQRLSTPSLGITKRGRQPARRRAPPFNSLSRDHYVVHLSGSISSSSAFNSLSRDHRTLFRDFPALCGFPPRRPFAQMYFSATI